MDINIPYKLRKETIHLLINDVINSDLRPVSDNIRLNFSNLTFIEPSGVTLLYNLILWLMKNGTSVVVTYPSQPNKALKYLDDSQFFALFIGKTITKFAAQRSTTLKLQNISCEDSIQWLDLGFAPWLSMNINEPINSLTTIKMCFGELFNNIKDHAQESTGCIFGQHYPRTNTIIISISDFGVGIPNNISKIRPSLNDAEALEYAIEEGVTSKTQPKNLGVGLHTLVKNVVEGNGGNVYIRSNYGILNCNEVNNVLNVSSTLSPIYYPGTYIEVVLRTDNIKNIVDFEEEFEW